MRILQVSPVLPVDVCAQAVSLSGRSWLAHLVTSTASNGGDLKGRLLRRWLGRREVRIRNQELRSVFASDVHQRLRRLTGKSQIESADERFNRVDLAASRYVDDALDAVVCREDAALETFVRARECGVMRIYDLPTAHYEFTRQLMKKEVELFPELESNFSLSDEYAARRTSRKERELRLADHILCPSRFVERSLIAGGLKTKSIHVLPFACDTDWIRKSTGSRRNVVLIVGQISARKGVHRVLKVWKDMGAHRTHTLRLIGDMRLPGDFLAQFKGLYEHVDSMPREDLFEQYATAKLFVANAMSEGMSIVIPEALSAGTPVIASRNSGAEEIVTDNEEGVLVEYGDDEALADSIERLLTSPELLGHMGKRARDKARSRTWDHYSLEFTKWMESVVTETSATGEI